MRYNPKLFILCECSIWMSWTLWCNLTFNFIPQFGCSWMQIHTLYFSHQYTLYSHFLLGIKPTNGYFMEFMTYGVSGTPRGDVHDIDSIWWGWVSRNCPWWVLETIYVQGGPRSDTRDLWRHWWEGPSDPILDEGPECWECFPSTETRSHVGKAISYA